MLQYSKNILLLEVGILGGLLQRGQACAGRLGGKIQNEMLLNKSNSLLHDLQHPHGMDGESYTSCVWGKEGRGICLTISLVQTQSM